MEIQKESLAPTTTDSLPTTGGAGHCPHCGEEWGALEAVASGLLRREPLRRCERCGSRFTLSGRIPREVTTCESCGLPFHADQLLPDQDPTCPDCRTGRFPAQLTDPAVIGATEREVFAELQDTWCLIGSAELSDYLDRIARQVAAKIPGAPEQCCVVVFDDRNLRTLALPSGTILLSVDMLDFMEDEAELAFVLAHELAHIASGDAGARLVWLSVAGVSQDQGDADLPGPWVRAAHDLIRVGHGRRREREADRLALEAVLALDYEPDSVMALLKRLDENIATGSERVRELAAAHPTPADRRRQIEKTLQDWMHGSSPPRVNRAVYRQVAGHSVLRSELQPLARLLDRATPPLTQPQRLAWTLAAIAALAALFLAIGLLIR